jgi:type I restriction-modification system DNA methylase subunit
MFAAADQKYDSGLFELLEEDRLTVSDSVIIEIFQSLYYPNNSYEFGVIDPYIIGQIYELFLDEALVIREDGHIETQEKPEVVDSQGAVNTPKNITDIIIEETLRPLYENKTPEEVAQYRIADICCGSGNFLLSAFEYIVNYHVEYYRNHDRENAERRGDIYQLAGSTNYILSYEKKHSILKNNIFGVDIDPLAVKTAKENGLMNNLKEPELTFVCGDLADKVTKKYDVVVANIVADIIILFSTQVKAFMKTGAKFIASGIIDTRADEVCAALQSAGLVLKERIEENGWVCLVCE